MHPVLMYGFICFSCTDSDRLIEITGGFVTYSPEETGYYEASAACEAKNTTLASPKDEASRMTFIHDLMRELLNY